MPTLQTGVCKVIYGGTKKKKGGQKPSDRQNEQKRVNKNGVQQERVGGRFEKNGRRLKAKSKNKVEF